MSAPDESLSAQPPFDSARLHAALQQHFGFTVFRPGQEEALQHLLAGRDTLVVMPTGSGKSLIYQLAALLVALMKDQVDGMRRRGIRATFINSALDLAEQNRANKSASSLLSPAVRAPTGC